MNTSGKKLALSLAAAGSMLAAAPAQDLKPGAAAPAFALAEMVRGDAVAKLRPGVVHLIEFWGAEAGSGFDRYEEFAKLRKRHGDKLVVTGVVGPDDENYDFDTVREYYAEAGPHIDFAIGFDGDGKLHEAWVAAAGAEAPHVFLVDQKGNLAWSGGLGFLPLALPVVLKGDVDYAKLAADQQEAEKKFMRLALVAGLKPEAATKELDELVAKWPALEYLATLTAWSGLLDNDDPTLALPLAERVCKVCSAEGDAMNLNGLAWVLVDPENEWADRKLTVAEQAAKKAVELTKGEDASILDTLARVHFWKQDYAQAVAVQKLAIAKATDDEERAAYAAVLADYEALLAGK